MARNSNQFFAVCIAAIILLATHACRRAEDAAPKPTPQSLSIAAASDLRFALDEIAAAFAKHHPGMTAAPTYGSSGNFFTQIQNGAPFDVYLSADIEYPRRLAAEGFAVPDSLFNYGIGQIVVWVRADSPLDPTALKEKILTDPRVKHIAIANPAHAPYGRAAAAAMATWGVSESVKDKIVHGENVSQAAQLAESGSADVGIIAHSLALAPAMRDKGKFWSVPAGAHPPLEQGGIITSRAKDSAAAQEFRQFMLGEDARAILKKYGFELSPL